LGFSVLQFIVYFLALKLARSICFNKMSHSEKPYRELVMLLTSWRTEDIALLKNYGICMKRS